MISVTQYDIYYGYVVLSPDVNECTTGDAVCPAGYECMNTLGSYNCVCPTGFTGAECATSKW